MTSALLLLVALAAPAFAHDLWLIPPATAKPGEKVVVRAVSGNGIASSS